MCVCCYYWFAARNWRWTKRNSIDDHLMMTGGLIRIFLSKAWKEKQRHPVRNVLNTLFPVVVIALYAFSRSGFQRGGAIQGSADNTPVQLSRVSSQVRFVYCIARIRVSSKKSMYENEISSCSILEQKIKYKKLQNHFRNLNFESSAEHSFWY